jgi:hypothetical protein
MKNVTPTPHKLEAQAAKWSAIGRAIAYCLYRNVNTWSDAKVERYRANTHRLSADQLGNYEIIHDPLTQKMLQSAPGNYQQPVYQTYSAHITYHNQVQGLLPEHAEAPFQAALAPTIDEVIKAIPRTGLQVGLGRSLTSGELLQIELPDNHIKLIGATRKGKSSMAGGILEQVRLTQDPNILQFALRDLENKTSRLFERSHTLPMCKLVDVAKCPPSLAALRRLRYGCAT